MRPPSRSRRAVRGKELKITLDQDEHPLLQAYALEIGRTPSTVAAMIVSQTLQAGRMPDGHVDRQTVDSVLRHIRGESDVRLNEPRWEWPIEALLADTRWWERWLPELNQLLGRELGQERGTYDKEGQPAIVDRRGYSNLLEYLFPTMASPRGAVAWRSPEYPLVAPAKDANEASPALRHIWEAVVRHVARALCSLEKAAQPEADPTAGILLQDHLTGPWLRTLWPLTGQAQPPALNGLKRIA